MPQGLGRFTFWPHDLVNDQFKKLFNKVVRRSKASGWWDIEDTIRTSFATGQNIDNTTAVIENNAGIIRQDQKPDFIDPAVFYDPEYAEFNFTEDGDVYSLTIDFEVRDASPTPSYLELDLFDGSTNRFRKSIPIVRGQNEDDHVNHTFNLRLKPGDDEKVWQIRMQTPDNLTIWNIAFEFVLIHRVW